MSVNYVIGAFDLSDSLTVDPSLASSAVDDFEADSNAAIIMSASSFNDVFWFAADSLDIDDIDASDISYACDKTAMPSITFSDGQVAQGDSVENRANTDVQSDMVVHLAKEIFGRADVVDLFRNEAALKTDIVSRDDDLEAAIDAALDAAGTIASPLKNNTAAPTNIVKSLLEQTIRQQPARLDNDNGDLLQTKNANGYYNLFFKAGDTLQMKVNYHCGGVTNPITSATDIADRSYKVTVTLN